MYSVHAFSIKICNLFLKYKKGEKQTTKLLLNVHSSGKHLFVKNYTMCINHCDDHAWMRQMIQVEFGIVNTMFKKSSMPYVPSQTKYLKKRQKPKIILLRNYWACKNLFQWGSNGSAKRTWAQPKTKWTRVLTI